MTSTPTNTPSTLVTPGEMYIPPLPRISIQAFCETQETAAAINTASADRRMVRTHLKIHMGGAPAAVQSYRDSPTPNVIVLETDGQPTTILNHLDQLADYCDPGTKVIVISPLNDITLYRALISRGVSEYIISPIDDIGFIAALSRLYHVEQSAPLGRVIAIVGAKGGVGASTIAHNLAWSIASQQDLATVIVDLDLGFGTVGLDFNQDPLQGIAEALFSPDRLDANMLDRLLSKCSQNLSILAAPTTLDRNFDLNENDLDTTIDLLRNSMPCIILDVPHVWTSWCKKALITADEVVVVAAPDLANFRNAKNLLEVLQQNRRNDNPPRLVLNGVGTPKRPEISTSEFTKQVEIAPTVLIPYEPKLFGTAANNGQMIAEIYATGKIAEAFSELSRLVLRRSELRKSKKSVLEPLTKYFLRKQAS